MSIATNNGEIGGGEIMMFSIAQALREDGVGVTIVAPSRPHAVAAEADARGIPYVALPARNRAEWMRALRRWASRTRPELLWCNGLVPSVATAGMPNRLVHLHQWLSRAHRVLAALARPRAISLIVPSESMLAQVPQARVLSNWTADPGSVERARKDGGPFIVGFIGRVSINKGIGVLSEAMRVLERHNPGSFRLVLAGEPRFVSRRVQRECQTALRRIAPMTDRIGWVDRDEFFSQIDLLAVPSIFPEAFGLVAAEAMAARVPLVVSDCGALPDVVGADHPLVAPAGDAQMLAAKILGYATGIIHLDLDAQQERWRMLFSREAGAREVQSLISAVCA
ncbi:glycosyltransferase family 4 protein [Microbacterium mangrovi]|uniref:glycosyltransferase family 4 protein n=1 Tax=Microbacterium mangrovi TaxID=1348253 RepID=UPI0018CE301D|nr:glycosyltransferase family 4 protein [Microbacterium mangrovi]